jgi:peptide-methionine (S)-S-oxide reductase
MLTCSMDDPQANHASGERLAEPKNEEVATLGGGCFWCTEAIFSELRGVKKVVPGFSGGTVPNPTYEQVCAGTTGHAEVVQITFDPAVISFKRLLQIFFTVHDPTTPNRQGADVGSQYRSIILYHTEEQKKIALEVMKEVEERRIWSRPIVTQLVPFKEFYEAEDYHRDYFKKNPLQPYCLLMISPKVRKFRKEYAELLKK